MEGFLMENTLVKSLYAQATHDEDVSVEVTGWLKTLRSSKKISFLEINDGSCIKNVQVIMENGLENYEEIKKAPIYTTLKVVGTAVDTPKAKQPFEIHATEIEVLGNSEQWLPTQKKHHTPEFLREQAHLRPRTNTSTQFPDSFVGSLCHPLNSSKMNQSLYYVNTPLITS